VTGTEGGYAYDEDFVDITFYIPEFAGSNPAEAVGFFCI
jgi:hypothetical protein